jgi:hypothetical protein
VLKIELVSSDHVLPVLGTRERINLHPLNQLIRNIRFVVVTLLAITHLYVLDDAGLIIVLVYIRISMLHKAYRIRLSLAPRTRLGSRYD